MKFSFIEVGDCNFTIKELHQRFFPVNFYIDLWTFYQYSESSYSTFTIKLQQFPWQSNNDLANTVSNQSFRGVIVKLFGQKKSQLSQGNVSGGALF